MKLLTKSALTIISVGVISFFVLFYITWNSTVDALYKKNIDELEIVSVGLMDKIDRYLYERMCDIELLSHDPVLTDPSSTPEMITRKLLLYRNILKSYFSISFFDVNQVRLADTQGLDIGEKVVGYHRWSISERPVVRVAEVEYSDSLEQYILSFSAPVFSEAHTLIGTVVSRVSVKKFNGIIGTSTAENLMERQLKMDLVDSKGVLIFSNHNRVGMFHESFPNWNMIASQQDKNVDVFLNYCDGKNSQNLLVTCKESGYLSFKGNNWTLLLTIPNDVIFASVKALQNRWTLVLIPSLFICILLTIYMSKRLAKPFFSLMDAVYQFGKGDLNTRVRVESSDEIGELARTFNHMASDLQATMTSLDSLSREIRLRKFAETSLKETVGKFRDIVALNSDAVLVVEANGKVEYVNPAAEQFFKRKAKDFVGQNFFLPLKENEYLEVEICRANNEKGIGEMSVCRSQWLEQDAHLVMIRDCTERKKIEKALAESAQLKLAFVSIASHELRTPLTAIREAISQLDDFIAGPLNEYQKRVVEITRRNVERLARLINDILDYQTLDLGKMCFRMEKNDINQVMKETKETLNGTFKDHGLQCLFALDSNIPKVKFDKDRIAQAILNLVNNAIKFTEKGTITISTKIVEGALLVSISDTGIGICQEDLKKLFRPYQQLNSSKGGTGLGLAITAAIVRAHGGRIWAESQEGGGTTIYFTLPTT